ncbi:hypothetical protein J3R82DRAFT_4156 [Butyriboletus roseoflavus]|nr:hypothetical protein J3R82DRAFT_4156 [Butyriboletus roseoflavus]
MSCGRVIGNELRGVPPECLPIWGQRWSGYRAPHGPSPFSTRIFSVDRMSEMGPVLTSPTQFETTLTEEDEGDDTSSESGRLYSTFPSSLLAIQPDATELTFRPETPAPRSVYCSSSHLHGSPEILHRSGGYPPPQNSTCFGTMLLQRQQSEHSDIQRHASEPLLHPPALHHEISIQCGCGAFEDDYTLWDMDRTSASIEPQAGPSYRSHVPSGQLQHPMPLHSIPEWQFANPHTQSSAYPIQANPLSLSGSDCLLQPSQAGDRDKFIATPPLPPTYCFTLPLSQQNVGVNSSWNHESSMTMIPSIAHSRNPVISQWASGSVPPNLCLPRALTELWVISWSRGVLSPGLGLSQEPSSSRGSA